VRNANSKLEFLRFSEILRQKSAKRATDVCRDRQQEQQRGKERDENAVIAEKGGGANVVDWV